MGGPGAPLPYDPRCTSAADEPDPFPSHDVPPLRHAHPSAYHLTGLPVICGPAANLPFPYPSASAAPLAPALVRGAPAHA
ncbi:hypothetical protein G6F40_017671 [Rhizopus arrhizus]|nr:hypothetical protein G6F40_017671 [Rhizopus arrhizus]